MTAFALSHEGTVRGRYICIFVFGTLGALFNGKVLFRKIVFNNFSLRFRMCGFLMIQFHLT